LAQYEHFQTYIGPIEKSTYNAQTEEVLFLLSHSLLPVKLQLEFKLARMKGEGVFPFLFEKGFLKGLTGKITTRMHEGRCVIYLRATWEGPHSGYSATLLELFVITVARIAMEKLLRISR
jgi:hypothetical protein